MAIYHATSKPISRSNGHSATAKCAYIGGSRVLDERTGVVFDYSKKHGVIDTEIVLPDGINLPNLTRENLWNQAEKAENRKDARVGREWEISLPHELNSDQRKALAHEITSTIANKFQVACEYALHEPNKAGDQRNYHVHILTTTRKIEKDGTLSEKFQIELSNTKLDKLNLPRSEVQITEIRGIISDLINKHLQLANVNETVSHLSLSEQGIDRVPTVHKGKTVTELERRNVKTNVSKIMNNIEEINNEIILLQKQIFDDGAELAKIHRGQEELKKKKYHNQQNSICGKYPKAYSNQLFNIALDYGDFLKWQNDATGKYYESKDGNVKVYETQVNVENTNTRDVQFALDIAVQQFGNYLTLTGDEKFIDEMIKTIASDSKYENVSLSNSELNQRLFDARIDNLQHNDTDNDIDTFIQSAKNEEQALDQKNGISPETQQNLPENQNLHYSNQLAWEHS